MIQRYPSLLVEMFIIISKSFLRAQRDDGLSGIMQKVGSNCSSQVEGFEAPREPAQFLGCRELGGGALTPAGGCAWRYLGWIAVKDSCWPRARTVLSLARQK